MKLTRRKTMAGLACGGLLTSSSLSLAAPAVLKKRYTFVLVHGSWHGGWCWAEVARILREAGHLVFAPTMTGCGERYHPIKPETGLYTHIKDVTNTIEWEELVDVVLMNYTSAL